MCFSYQKNQRETRGFSINIHVSVVTYTQHRIRMNTLINNDKITILINQLHTNSKNFFKFINRGKTP